MPAHSWIRTLFARKSRTLRKSSGGRRLTLETLEDRTLPAVSFSPGVNYATGVAPSAVAVGDFNGDGRQDLVTANDGGASVSVLLGNGNGTFQSAVSYLMGTGARSVAVADINNDGRLDLATANSGANTVSVRLGNGNGTFGSASNFAVEAGPGSVAVADLNGDGRADLVTAHPGNNYISVRLRNSTGASLSFQNAVLYSAGMNASPQFVVARDVTNDGLPEIITANTGADTVSVFRNVGAGAFAQANQYYAGLGASPQSVAVADFSGDGLPDLVTANRGDGSVSVFRNGTPNLGSFGNRTTYAAGLGANSVAVGDFNRDGLLDIATANSSTTTASVLLNGGSGIIRGATNVDAGTMPFAVAAGDWNGDNKTDLAVARSGSHVVSILLNTSVLSIEGNQTNVVGNEGSVATNTGYFDDPLGRNLVTLSASIGSGTVNNTTGAWTWTYTPPEGPAGPTAVTITARNTVGQTATFTFNLTVNNVAPTITSTRFPSIRNEGSLLMPTASATDPGGANDPLTYTWTVTRPDGTMFTLSGPAPTFTPPDDGLYRLNLTVADDDGGSTSTPFYPGQVGWYRGDGNAVSFTGANNGTASGAVTYTDGRVGPAFNFGDGGVVQVPDSASLDLTGAVTMEAWVAPSTLAFPNGAGAVVGKGASYALFVQWNGGVTLLYQTTGGTWTRLDTAAGVVRPVDFNHLAGVIDPVSGVMQIYRNGQLMASGATGGPLVANSSPLTIGRVDIYQFLGIIDEVSVFNRALSASEVASIYNAAGAGKSLALEVANVAPTPILSGFTTNLATQVVDYTFSGTDPSPVDQAAGFQYRIEWGDGMHQAVAQAAGNAAGTRLSHRYAAPGTYTATLTAFDKDGDSSSTTRTITVLAVTSGNMQKVIDQQGKITLHATTDAEAQAVVTAVNGLSAQTSFKTITLSLGSGTYSGTTASPKANITLVIIGSGGTTTIVGHSPSLNVTEGTVIVSDLTLTNATDAPTIHVSNGNLTLRNVVIEESNAADQAAVLITGGTVDLGRPDDPGGNRFNTNGLGKLIRHTGGNAVSAAGNTFQTDGATLTSPYRIEDGIDHAVDTGAGGTVSFVLGNTYVTVSGGSIQRGIDAVAEDGTVNVEAGSYTNYDVGSKRLTLRFDNGPTLSQEPNAQDPSLRDLVITGTAAADQIQVTQGGASIQAQVRGVPNGRFNPTGQLVIHGGAGDDAISVASGIDLTAWLYGDAGNDALSGGGGTNVLLGGSGDDQLIGSQGRDLLIGGLGADLLNGNDGDDLLIAGLTAFDDDATALAAILAEWTSARSYAERVANLRNTLIGSGPDATVFDDGAPDQLRGASGKDWFFANLSGGILDAVNNQDGSELVEELTSDI